MKSSRIVVGVDGSAASVAALRWAARQAAFTGSMVDAMISWQYPGLDGDDFYNETIDWAALARQTLDAAVAEAGRGEAFSCTRTVTEGHPANVLVAASADAELLIVGSRGHGGFAGLLLGSVSAYVIAHATCPVLVIRQQHSTSPTDREAS